MTNAVNDQITDSVTTTIINTVGNAPADSFAMLDTVMSETIGMLMHGAVSSQHNAQMIGNASVTATCARILGVPVASPSGGGLAPINPVKDPEPPSDLAQDISLNYNEAQSAVSSLNQDLKQAENNEKNAKSLLQKLADMARGS